MGADSDTEEREEEVDLDIQDAEEEREEEHQEPDDHHEHEGDEEAGGGSGHDHEDDGGEEGGEDHGHEEVEEGRSDGGGEEQKEGEEAVMEEGDGEGEANFDGEGDQGIELELTDAMGEEDEEGPRVEGVQDGPSGDEGMEGGEQAGGGEKASKEAAGEEPAASGKDRGVDRDLEPGDPLLRPPHGTELFFGGVGAEVTEDDLRRFCQGIGEIFEVRLMKDKESGSNKPFAFVTFCTKEAAEKAIEQLSGKELKGKSMRVTHSQARNRLFVGNVPKSWTKEEVQAAFEAEGKGITSVDLLMDPKVPNRNRGFAFVDYYNHGCAEVAKRNMSKSHFRLSGMTPTVSWADPRDEPDPATLANVKVVYVKGLSEKVTEELLKDAFSQFGEVSRVVLPAPRPGQPRRDFGFVHFEERSCALKAIEQSEKVEVDGKPVEVSLAKPVDKRPAPGSLDDQHARGRAGAPLGGAHVNKGGGPLLPSYPGYGYGYGSGGGERGPGYGGGREGGGGYGGYPSGGPWGRYAYGAGGLPTPIICGRGPAPSGMVMVPMMLPDGRVGYMFQRESDRGPPGAGPGGDSRSGSGGSGSMYRGGGPSRPSSGSGDAPSKSDRRYRPY